MPTFRISSSVPNFEEVADMKMFKSLTMEIPLANASVVLHHLLTDQGCYTYEHVSAQDRRGPGYDVYYGDSHDLIVIEGKITDMLVLK